MTKTFSLNPSLFYSANDEKLNIISLEDSNNEIISLNKVNALIFPDIVNGKTEKEILAKITDLPDCPPKEEVQDYFNKFVEKLEDLKIILPK
jgi:hypothetical protein